MAFSFHDLLRTPAARRADRVELRYVAFDLLAQPDARTGSRDVRDLPLRERWSRLEGLLADVPPPIELVMATPDRDKAMVWFDSLDQVGVEGLVVKPYAGEYGGLRWVKIRHADTVDAEAVAVLGSEAAPAALAVRLPDGREAITTTLNDYQAREVASALPPPFPVEVRVIAGRHAVVRFVRVRGE